MRIAIIGLCLGMSVLVAACGKPDKGGVTISGKGGDVTVSGNGEHMTMKSDDGKTTVEINSNGAGNVSMPEFAPLYPGAKVQSSVATGGNGGAMVMFAATAAPADVIAFYKQKSAAAGLGETMNASEGGAMTFVASKDKKTVQVIVTKSDGGSRVQVIWVSGG